MACAPDPSSVRNLRGWNLQRVTAQVLKIAVPAGSRVYARAIAAFAGGLPAAVRLFWFLDFDERGFAAFPSGRRTEPT